MSDLLLIIRQGHQQQPFFSCSRPTVVFSLIESLIETLKNPPETMRCLVEQPLKIWTAKGVSAVRGLQPSGNNLGTNRNKKGRAGGQRKRPSHF